MADKTAPDTQLRLDWVYGYRGHQCRSNLFYTSANEVVYFVAGVAIIVDQKKQKQKFFLGHNDDIISLAIHPTGQLVATGQVGKAPYICIWESATVKTVSILKDQHTHGIAAMAFSGNGERLASVGLDGNNSIIVWDWRKGRALSNTRGHTDRIFDVHWSAQDKFVTCGVKHIKFWTLSGNLLSNKRGVFGKVGDVQTALCVRCHTDGVTYSGMLSGDIYIWADNVLQRMIPQAHNGGIFTIHSSADGFATAGKDGCVRLWDSSFNSITTINLVDSSLGYKGLSVRAVCWNGTHVLVGTHDGEVFEVSVRDPGHPNIITTGHGEGEMWGLAVHPKKSIVATGSDDRSIRLWSIQDHALLARCNLPNQVRSCALSGEYLAAGCINGSVIVVRTRDMSSVAKFHDRKEAIHEIRFSPQGSYLAVASNDNFVDIYSVQERYHRVGTCKKSSSFITHIDWSSDEQYLQTNDGAGERLVYSMPTGNHVTSGDVIRAVKWDTWTCVLGAQVAGIWPKYSQINDVNAACADENLGVIATGDDAGLVKLLRYPSLKKGANFRKYVGHSAHVTNVRFTTDSNWLMSAGGGDHALFQWRVLSQSDDAPDGGRHGMGAAAIQDSYVDSNSEDSDSSLSDVAEIDSEVEKEREASYSRVVDRKQIKQVQRSQKGTRRRDAAPSNTSMSLQFVYGYRGYDCRDNVFYSQNGEVIYHVAALGIVMSREDRKQRFYTGHDDDILSLAVHPIKDFVATGQVGKDAVIHIWDAETMKTMSVLQGFHTHGVSSLNFSGDGKRLVSIGLDNDHMMAIWDWRRGEKLASAKAHQDKVFSVKFDTTSSEKLVTVGIKHLKFWQHVGGGLTSKRGVFGTAGKPDTMLCVAQGKQAGVTFTGAANGQVYVWNGNNLTRTQKAHDGPCFAMHALDKGFVTGGRDGVVSLWDESFDRCLKSYSLANQALSTQIYGKMLEDNPSVRAITLGHGKILVGTKNSEILEVDKSGPITLITQGHGEGELWGLATHPTQAQVATVSDDKSVRTWNVGPNEMNTYVHANIATRKLSVGGRCCGYSPDGTAIAVGCNDGSFMVLNSVTLEDMVKFHNRKEAISDIKFSPGSGKYLAVASHDNFVDIYSVLGSKRVGVCKGASSYITHIDWDISGRLLRVNSGAKELLFYEAPRGTRQTISEDTNIEWNSWTGVLGKHCTGIWPPCSDVTDVNAASLSRSGDLATGDDFGFVKLFSFPALGKHAKFKKYSGHSAHVTNVRWTHDNTQLASVGGGDTALFIWQKNNIAIAGSDGAAAKDSPVNQDLTYHGDSEDSDTDSEEEGGYDSDVAHEKNMNYDDKIYKTRDMQGVKSQLQKESESKPAPVINRAMKQSHKVVPRSGLALDKVEGLELHHVFGYRGFDCRDNLRYVNEGILYHAAGACIFQDLSTGEQSFYLEHTDDVISLTTNQHPKFSGIVATGQLGSVASVRIWDVTTKQTVGVLQGPHQRGVCSLDFSASGKLLLTVGLEMEHFAAIWRWQEGVMACKVSCSPHRIFRAQFRPDSDSQFVSVGVKHVSFWRVCGSTAVPQRAVLGATTNIRMQTMLSIAFGADNLTFTGAMSGDIYVWKSHVLHRTVAQAHEGPVFTMFTTLQDGLIITGGKDKSKKEGSSVKLWDQEMRRCRAFVVPAACVKSVCRAKGKLIVGTKDSQIFEVGEKSGACSALVRGHAEGLLGGLASHPTSHLCCTTSKDNTARIWDINEKILLHHITLPSGGTCCCYSCDGRLLAVGMDNGQIQVLGAISAQLWDSRRDRGGVVHDLRFSPDCKMLAVATSDQCIDLYTVGETNLQRAGYIRNVTAIQMDFSADSSSVQITTDKYERKIFRVPKGDEVTEKTAIDGLSWDTWTSFYGKEVLGIWPKDAQSADINCAHVTNAGNTIVTGDDSGFVKIFDFPCQEKHSSYKKYTGHSAHVTNTRFSCDDRNLISIGGDDCCVFVWKCEP